MAMTPTRNSVRMIRRRRVVPRVPYMSMAASRRTFMSAMVSQARIPTRRTTAEIAGEDSPALELSVGTFAEATQAGLDAVGGLLPRGQGLFSGPTDSSVGGFGAFKRCGAVDFEGCLISVGGWRSGAPRRCPGQAPACPVPPAEVSGIKGGPLAAA